MENTTKFCECGCGQATKIFKRTNRRVGHIRGQAARFLLGHWIKSPQGRAQLTVVRQKSKKRTGPDHPNWKGGRYRSPSGYIMLSVEGKRVLEHRVVAEQILGRPLVSGEVVHHRNGDKSDNRPENLEVIASNSEHMRQHHARTPELASEIGRRAAEKRWGNRGSSRPEGGRECLS